MKYKIWKYACLVEWLEPLQTGIFFIFDYILTRFSYRKNEFYVIKYDWFQDYGNVENDILGGVLRW